MKAPNLSVTLTTPDAGTLQALGIGLLSVALAQVLLVSPFSNFSEVDGWNFTWFVFAVMFLSVGASLGSVALMAVVIWGMLRGQSTLAASGERVAKEFRFVHVAVLIHAIVVLATLLTALDGGLMPPEVLWSSLSGAAVILAMLNRLRWDAPFALVGAAVSIATFGCAVRFAPTIYGWDLRPLGWYAILAAAVPVLAFLVVFLRRAPVFHRFRALRLGLAAALFTALACAVGFQMASNPNNEFSERLRTALDGCPSQIGFSELTDFEWDNVEVYGSYTLKRNFSPASREGADILSRSSVRNREIGDLAVFVKDGETVYYELVRNNRHSFRFPPGSSNPTVLKPEDAVFEVECRPDGYRRLTISERR